MVWCDLDVVWGGLEVVWGGVGCFGVVWGVSTDRAMSCLGGSVGRTREYCTLIFLSSALLVRILHATFIFVTTLKTFVLFLLNFLLLKIVSLF